MKHWLGREVAVLKEHPTLPVKDLMTKLPGRSEQAIRRKRADLGLTAFRSYRNWYPSDDRQLAQLAKSKGAIEVARLMERGVGSVRTRAETLGITFKSEVSRYVQTGDPLVDAVRQRCEEDGISVRDLDRELKTGAYFSSHCLGSKARRRGRPVIQHIAKAVEFFGGQLVIDWQDE
ncbi:hypothetical protein [Bradyrhizobium sp. SZCCHNS3053]|uniref:hypothetical protein n=1 Tax=Bradyrhizobium sp. SZCCHNS3053 TaxID=3057322 RepID=UPI0029170C81|nr:hypothetical protein [Bradyrhizobium sp. SZCCHNS3053]